MSSRRNQGGVSRAATWNPAPLVLLLVAAAWAAATPAAADAGVEAAVFGGYPAVKGRYRWMAATITPEYTVDEDTDKLIFSGKEQHTCGASLIHPRILLGAAREPATACCRVACVRHTAA